MEKFIEEYASYCKRRFEIVGRPWAAEMIDEVVEKRRAEEITTDECMKKIMDIYRRY